MFKTFIQRLKDIVKKIGTKLSCKKRCTHAGNVKHEKEQDNCESFL